MNARVRVMHPVMGERVFYTRDISDGGLFIIVEEENDGFWSIGELMQVQALGLPFPAPVLPMSVVRQVADGFGLEFLPEINP